MIKALECIEPLPWLWASQVCPNSELCIIALVSVSSQVKACHSPASPIYGFPLSSERSPGSLSGLQGPGTHTSLSTFHPQRPCSVLHKHCFFPRTFAHDGFYTWNSFPWAHSHHCFTYNSAQSSSSWVLLLFHYKLFSSHLTSFSPSRMQAFL